MVNLEQYKQVNESYLQNGGYLDIDLNLFGNALRTLFSKYYGYPFYFNKCLFTYMGKSRSGLNYYDIKENRFFYLIEERPNIHPRIQHPFSERSVYIKENDDDSMFKQKPLSMDYLNAYTMYFGVCDTDVIKLGTIENNAFVANTMPFNGMKDPGEVVVDNSPFDIVADFIDDIIKYKIENDNPTITQEDMEKILETYGISCKNEAQNLANVLRNGRNKAIALLLETQPVGDVLSLKKNTKK